jgi:hypothetical protein
MFFIGRAECPERVFGCYGLAGFVSSAEGYLHDFGGKKVAGKDSALFRVLKKNLFKKTGKSTLPMDQRSSEWTLIEKKTFFKKFFLLLKNPVTTATPLTHCA